MYKYIYLSILATSLVSIASVSGQQQQQQVLAVDCTTLASKPNVTSSKYNFQNCIVAQFGVYLEIGAKQFIQLNNGTVNPGLSKCHNETANPEVQPQLVVDFPCTQLVLKFNHTPVPKAEQKVMVEAILGHYTLNGTQYNFLNTTNHFATTMSGHYYKCNAEQAIGLSVTNVADVSIHFSNVRLEAYKTTNGTDFYAIPEECALDNQPISDLVRIGVGICLIALVAIVLVAYFIGRRRWSERSSYESV